VTYTRCKSCCSCRSAVPGLYADPRLRRALAARRPLRGPRTPTGHEARRRAARSPRPSPRSAGGGRRPSPRPRRPPPGHGLGGVAVEDARDHVLGVPLVAAPPGDRPRRGEPRLSCWRGRRPRRGRRRGGEHVVDLARIVRAARGHDRDVVAELLGPNLGHGFAIAKTIGSSAIVHTAAADTLGRGAPGKASALASRSSAVPSCHLGSFARRVPPAPCRARPLDGAVAIAKRRRLGGKVGEPCAELGVRARSAGRCLTAPARRGQGSAGRPRMESVDDAATAANAAPARAIRPAAPPAVRAGRSLRRRRLATGRGRRPTPHAPRPARGRPADHRNDRATADAPGRGARPATARGVRAAGVGAGDRGAV
jgi:hypothetical protein